MKYDKISIDLLMFMIDDRSSLNASSISSKIDIFNMQFQSQFHHNVNLS